MTDETEAQFGGPDCTCMPWTRQGGEPRYLDRPTDTVDMIGGWERRRDCPHHRPAAVTPAPAPAPEQVAAAVEEAIWSADNGSFHQVDVDLIRTAVLAVPAIRALAETRDALRVATGDRDAYDRELQQLREELAEARGQIERVRKAVAERRTELAEYEAEHEPSGWSDAVTVTCSRIEDALRIFPEPRGIPCPDDPKEPS